MDYSCVVDASAFAAPYIGCVSFETSCGDLKYCVHYINSLPDIGNAGKSLTLSYSPVVVFVFIFGGSFLLACAALTIIVFILARRKILASPVVWLLLNLACLFVVISGAFYFSMGLPWDSGDCYSNQDLNNTFATLNSLNLGYLEVYFFNGMFAVRDVFAFGQRCL